MQSKKDNKNNNTTKDNELKAGVVEAYIHSNQKIGVLLELKCKTDFASRSPEFQELAHNLAMQIAAMGTKKLLSQTYIKDPSKTIKDLVQDAKSVLKEPIELGKFVRYEL